MKTSLLLFAFVSGVLLTSMQAATRTVDQPATVLSVAIHQTPSDPSVTSPLDSPLQPEVYSYDIGIRVGAIVYRTRYDSTLEYLPAVFSENHAIQVSLKNHLMYVDLPGDRAARMVIEGRTYVGTQISYYGNPPPKGFPLHRGPVQWASSKPGQHIVDGELGLDCHRLTFQ